MRRFSIGRSIAALVASGVLALAPMAERSALRPSAPMISNRQRRPLSKRKKGRKPSGRSAQSFDKSRLICDRSSSFKKLRRWARAGT